MSPQQQQTAVRRQTSITPPSGIPAQMGRYQLAAMCRIALENAMLDATPERLKQIEQWLKR